MKYLCLLRGINVGGNRRVEMVRLVSVLAACGFTDIKTYINSGNAVFSCTKQPDAITVQRALEKEFGFDIDILILDSDKVRKITAAVPKDWQNNTTDQKSDVAYLFPDVDDPDIVKTIAPRPEIEKLIYIPGAVLFSVSRKNQSKSSLLKIIGTPLYKRMTIRNVTTARKLAEMMDN